MKKKLLLMTFALVAALHAVPIVRNSLWLTSDTPVDGRGVTVWYLDDYTGDMAEQPRVEGHMAVDWDVTGQTNGVTRLGLLSAVTGSVTVAFRRPLTGETVNAAHDDGRGRLVTDGAPLPVGTHRAVGTVDYTSGVLSLDVKRLARMGGYRLLDETQLVARVTWTADGFRAGEGRALVPVFGIIRREFDSWFDRLYEVTGASGISGALAAGVVDGENVWKPGDPYGATLVTNDVPFYEIGLTRTSPSMLRIDLREAVHACDFATANAFTDRGVAGSYYPNVPSGGQVTNLSGAARVRVKVVRTYFNEISTNALNERIVFDKVFNLNGHPYLTEADLLAMGLHDVDWGTLRSDWTSRPPTNRMSLEVLTNAVYRIVFGDGTVTGNTFNNLYPVLFANAFERRTSQTKAVPEWPIGGEVYSAQPTFKWSHEALDATGARIKDYPAFRLRVWTASTNIVYDSGVRSAPPHTARRSYAFTLPEPLAAGTYWWSVSMLDAKFLEPNSDEVRAEFTVAD